jgi:D-alanyl-lipoteichoic acid acyltransferase DltB (MBOAT superfamily)
MDEPVRAARSRLQMLFNSYPFLFVFLPIVFLVSAALSRCKAWWAAAWLALSSLAFYSVWNYRYLPLLLLSIVFNYLVGRYIAKAISAPRTRARARSALALGVTIDLVLLCYFKYLGFFLSMVSPPQGGEFSFNNTVLPLGISFFTFTQIAFLVDIYREETSESGFVNYLLFVSYFPHLIAGPILHHRHMVPQFTKPGAFRLDWEKVGEGLTVLAVGLFKKVVIADNWAIHADAVFGAASQGQAPLFLDAWVGALAYTLQLYFDFSGYCDMAIGLSLLFNVRLPLNFDSPYKSRSIIEFWQRWHITLSSFLRDYLYIPLGGNRRGTTRRYVNLMVTMVLGGLWHGAGWTFLAWGALHGAYLIVNHAWRSLRGRRTTPARQAWAMPSCALTFLCVVAGWVLFRADTLSQAQTILKGMAGLNGMPHSVSATYITNVQPHEWLTLVVVWCLPNLNEVFRSRGGITLDSEGGPARPAALASRFWRPWAPSVTWAILAGFLLFASVLKINSDGASSFLYFQF